MGRDVFNLYERYYLKLKYIASGNSEHIFMWFRQSIKNHCNKFGWWEVTILIDNFKSGKPLVRITPKRR